MRHTGTIRNRFGYSGQWGGYTDSETGLVLLTHRFYDPETGRFLTRDPIGYEGGINLYAYVGGNPVNWTDPLGWKKQVKKPKGIGFWSAVATGASALGGFVGGAIEKAARGTSTTGKIIGGVLGFLGAGVGGYSDYCTFKGGAETQGGNLWGGDSPERKWNRAYDGNRWQNQRNGNSNGGGFPELEGGKTEGPTHNR
jgi:RHS repeat-associated protein